MVEQVGALRHDPFSRIEAGHDIIDGDQGNDYIRGGDGNDNILGGLGSDNIAGEAGNDIFVTRNDLPEVPDLIDPSPFPPLPTFDRVDGGPGFDRADGDDLDRLISIEATFITPGL